MPTPNHLDLAQDITYEFQQIESVQAVAVAGSRTNLHSIDKLSDIDLYIYHSDPISMVERSIIAQKFSDHIEIDNPYWGSEDAWIERRTGIKMDVVYWDTTWIADQIARILVEYQAWLGYTTCFWHTVRVSEVLFDRTGWFKDLQRQANVPYPETLRQNIVALNLPVLRTAMPSYINQIKAAVVRQDLVSLNHRLAAFLASYFDVLFAINRVLHPGEKRLLQIAPQICLNIPPNMQNHIQSLFMAAALADPIILDHLHELVNGLENLLSTETAEGHDMP